MKKNNYFCLFFKKVTDWLNLKLGFIFEIFDLYIYFYLGTVARLLAFHAFCDRQQCTVLHFCVLGNILLLAAFVSQCKTS